MTKLQAVLVSCLLALAAGGCKSGSKSDPAWSGPGTPIPIKVDHWTYDNKPARKITTPHYAIYTTIADNRVVDEMSQVMEGAYAQYTKLVPGLTPSDRPMDCYVFATRAEWNDFTLRHTGPAASTYLKITRGGYAVGDWYVAYYLGNASTYSVASHEGWHQFCGRNFKSRLPPFLEEGIATLFEGVTLGGPQGLPRWNTSVNLNRAVRLREAVYARRLWPLEKLITLHAGQIVDARGGQIDAFYAQNWAFARFLVEDQNAKYRPALHQLLRDVAAGQIFDPITATTRPATSYRPTNVKPILEHYLGIPFPQLEKEYLNFVNRISYEQFQTQWGS